MREKLERKSEKGYNDDVDSGRSYHVKKGTGNRSL